MQADSEKWKEMNEMEDHVAMEDKNQSDHQKR